MPTPTTSIRLKGALDANVSARADGGGGKAFILQRDAERYYEVLRRSLPVFSVPEASLLVDALNGCRFEPQSTHHLWANVDDAVRHDGLGERWEVDGPALVERLRALGYAEMVAVVDAIERFWVGPYRQEGPMEPRLREVGLVK